MRRFSLALALLALLLVSCDNATDATTRRACAGASATRYQVASVTPTMRRFNEVHTGFTGTTEAPRLPYIGNVTGDRGYTPLSVSAYDSTTGAPVSPVADTAPAYTPKGLQPVEQLIYGGSYEQDEEIQTYRLGINDALSLIVEDHPELSGALSVLGDGTVELPLVRTRIPARDLTVEQLRSAIVTALTEYVRAEPQVRLDINFAAGQYYYVLGEVGAPGRYPLGVQSITVSEAIFRANSTSFGGGYNTQEEAIRALVQSAPRTGYGIPMYANLRQVYLITPHRSRPTRELVNVKAVIYQGEVGEDRIVKTGQIIFVPSTVDGRFMRFIERFLAPLDRAENTDATMTHWYERTTGNQVDSVSARRQQSSR